MQPITAADYHDLVRVTDPQLSPNGKCVAFVRAVPEDDESVEATIHVGPVDSGDSRQFTVTEGVDAEPRWHPNGDFLAFTSTRGADDDRSQLWLLPTDGGEARQVTQVVGGASGIEWSPDGRHVLFVQRSTAEDRETGRDLSIDPAYEPDEPDPRVIDRSIYRTAREYVDGRRSHVYVLDVEEALAGDLDTDGDTDSPLRRLTDGDDDYVSPTWGDDGTVYYASKHGADPDESVVFDLYAHTLETDDATVFTQTTGWATELDATEDGRVAFAYTPEAKISMRQTELVVHDRETGEEVTPTEPLDRTVGYDCGFGWSPEGESLYFTTPDEGSVALWSVPGDASAVPKRVHGYDGGVREPDEFGTPRGHGVTVAGFSVGADTIAVVQSEWDHPGDVFVLARDGENSRRLTRVNDEYRSERAVVEPEELRFESEQGPVQGWVATPPDFDPDETYPLAVEIHGGPHAQWTTSGTMWHEFQTLAARGYVVFWCNPSGSTGYGEAHAMAIERDWGDVTLTDVLAGVETVCEREYVDEANQFVTGGSFGGFMTAWTVGRTDRFRAAVAQRGLYDLTGFYGSTDAYKLIEGDFGVTPWDDPTFLWERSPVSLVPEVETPTLVVHSDRDVRTPANTAELFYLGLRKHGVDTRLVRYPREGHELSRSGEPGHVVDRIERIVRWFDGYSDHHDVPPALERGRNEGLTAGEDEPTDDEEGDDGTESDGADVL